MKSFTREVPTMYGDHHVTEVRELLLAIPGVADVYASSSFQVIEVEYDETRLDAARIEDRLREAGYLEPLAIPVEREATRPHSNGGKAYFRHTEAQPISGRTVRFVQNVPYRGRSLWPCPGMGVVQMEE
jgi:copper chaperone CopZ